MRECGMIAGVDVCVQAGLAFDWCAKADDAA